MFKLQPNPTFKVNVNLTVAGQAKPASIEVEFKYLSRPEYKAFFESLEGKSDADALAEVVVGWSGVDASYSAEALAVLLDNYIPAGKEMFEAFVTGVAEAKRKN